MRATTSLTAAALLGAALLTAPTATAAGETCRGEAATIVGRSGEIIRGTEGRDVVVTNSSQAVFTRGGDDLVCITGRPMARDVTRGLHLFTGEGNDIVDATLAPRGWPVDLGLLGPGADEFYGGVDNDYIDSGPLGETDRDVIHGGAGRDLITTKGGEDEVYGDDGVDTLRLPASLPPAAVVDGGRARDDVVLAIDNANWSVDLATGATRDDVRTHTWSSVEGLTAARMLGYLHVTGTPASDEVTLLPQRGRRPLVDVRTGAGDDTFWLTGGLEDTSGIDLGAGADEARFDRDGSIRLDLAEGTLVMGGVASVDGIEDATAYARTVRLVGTRRSDRLRAGQCRTRIEGGGGDDDISWGTSNYLRIGCDIGQQTRISGGPGNDRIVGSWDPDLIDAGPGRDTVDGSRGRDRCASAERRTSCES